ncbi:MAG TPA: hypothetical protein VIX87_11760 [Steroidobacteraceae bacterium]
MSTPANNWSGRAAARDAPAPVWVASCATCCCLLLLACGCSDINWPFHHHSGTQPAAAPAAGAAGDDAAQCADIRAQIKDSEEDRREAPTTTTNPDIVNAAQGKADKRIEDLRERYESMDCPDETPGSPIKIPPLQPAPGGGNR